MVTRLLQKVVKVEALQVMSLLLLKMLAKALVLKMLEEVMLVALSLISLFTSPPTLTTRPCGACLTQNISKAGDPDLGRGERTNWGTNLPVARCLFLFARHVEGARTIIFCQSDRGWLFPLTRYRPPRDARDTP